LIAFGKTIKKIKIMPTTNHFKELLDLQDNPLYMDGPRVTKVPVGLQKLFPGVTFLSTKQMPGIYVLYFEKENKVYIGKSVNVTREVSMYKTKQRTQIIINQLVESNKENFVSFALLQGLPLKPLLKPFEILTIGLTQSFNINTIYNKTTKTQDPVKTSTESFLKTSIITGKLTAYGLNYVGVEPPTDQGCIYLIINPKTLRVYVGETQNFVKSNVIKRHRSNITSYFKRQEASLDLQVDRTTQKLANDLSRQSDTLLFT
jgi:hypothetical protein